MEEEPEEEAEEESEAESEEPDEEAEEELLYAVKVDGSEQEVTLDELMKGYSRQSDYTKKTQELAEGRKAIGQARRVRRRAGHVELHLGAEKPLYQHPVRG